MRPWFVMAAMQWVPSGVQANVMCCFPATIYCRYTVFSADECVFAFICCSSGREGWRDSECNCRHDSNGWRTHRCSGGASDVSLCHSPSQTLHSTMLLKQRTWNSLPLYLRSPTISGQQFQSGLKTHLFKRAYIWLLPPRTIEEWTYLLTNQIPYCEQRPGLNLRVFMLFGPAA